MWRCCCGIWMYNNNEEVAPVLMACVASKLCVLLMKKQTTSVTPALCVKYLFTYDNGHFHVQNGFTCSMWFLQSANLVT